MPYCSKLTVAALAAVVAHCPNLEKLDVANCGLTTLPDDIGSLSELEEFTARDNLFMEVPGSILDLEDCVLNF